MSRNPRSAGLLLFRRRPAGVEVFLVHPGGPFWTRRDLGAWTIPKGGIADGEDPLAAACREFEEETGFAPSPPFIDLGEIRQRGGKTVLAWACEGDADPARATSNTVLIEWPPRSGQRLEIPEADQWAWFDLRTARLKMNPAQGEFLDRLDALLTPKASEP
jgi:predicted NUDIX family NTP pyrophosphohydrolase